MTTARASFELKCPPSFELSACAAFYRQFTPMGGTTQAQGETLTLAFRLDRSFEAVGVRLHQQGRVLHGAVVGTRDLPATERQVRRMLGLDVDADAWVALGAADPAVGTLQRQFEGFFTAAFPSPYEAALGGVIAQRTSVQQAAVVRRALSEQHGEQVLGLWVVPSPEQLLRARSSVGLSAQKLDDLHGLGLAAARGVLDAERLRAMPTERALELLEALPGVGAWTAEHILFRGGALPDALPTAEPRVARGVALALGLTAPPSPAELRCLAERWRPFRMWVCILAARHLVAAGQWAKAQGDVRGRRARAPAQLSMVP